MRLTHQRQRERRGVAILLVLGMLGLFAGIGLMTALLSKLEGQGARNFRRSLQDPSAGRPDLPDVKSAFQFVANQVVWDTPATSPSALRGHSLLRDVYGGPDAEDRVLTTDAAFEPFGGAFNGTGIFAPRDNNPPPLTALPADTILDGTITPPAWNGQIDTGVGTSEVAYFLGRLRPPATFPGAISGATWDPVLPFNFTPFNLITHPTTGLALRPATPTVGGSLPAPEEYFDGTDTHHFAYDEDYDAADHNNMFLALERADGQILVPSYHRPQLVAQLEASGIFATSTPAGNAWTHPQGRRVILRPRAVDYDAVTVGYAAGGNRFPAMADTTGDGIPEDIDGSGAIGDCPSELDVDTDGDGLKDAIWLDVGYRGSQLVSLPGGGFAMPLAAIKVVAMDGKVNLNVHGNWMATVPVAPALSSQHASNLGASVTEINPQHLLLLRQANSMAAPDWDNQTNEDLHSLLQNVFGRWNHGNYTLATATDAAGANGEDYSSTQGDATDYTDMNRRPDTGVSPFDYYTSLLGPADLWGMGVYYEPFCDHTTTSGLPSYSTAKNIHGMFLNYGRYGLQVPRQYPPALASASTALTEHTLTTDDATEFSPYAGQLRVPATVALSANVGEDRRFGPAHIENLLRFTDIDATLQNNLIATQMPRNIDSNNAADPYPTGGTPAQKSQWLMRQYSRTRMRRMFTHESWDLARYNMPPVFAAAAAASGYPESSDTHDPASNKHNGKFGWLSNAVATDLANPTTNDGATGFGARLPIEVQQGKRYDLSRPLVAYEDVNPTPASNPVPPPAMPAYPNPIPQHVSPVLAHQQRTDMAEQLYVLLWLSARPDPTSPNFQAQARMLAQIAVNIVDYMDPDDVMTRMVFDADLTNVVDMGDDWSDPPPAGEEWRIVFGFELPKLVINEAIALVYPRMVGAATDERIWMWAELHNPWAVDNDGSDRLNTILNDDPAGGTGDPIYQLVVRARDGSFANTVNFQAAESIHGMPLSALQVGSKGSGNEYFVVGPQGVDPLAMMPMDPDELLANWTEPTVGASDGDNDFSANGMYVASTPTRTDPAVQFSLRRLANPYDAPGASNPYIEIDFVELETLGSGLYEIEQMSSMGTYPLDTRITMERVQPWIGEQRVDDSGTPGWNPDPMGSGSTIDETIEKKSFGKPDCGAAPTATAFVLSTDPTNYRTFGAVNTVDDPYYLSFPFLNRPLASPLELLSLRLYGSHYWYEPEAIWRLRFTDDFEFDFATRVYRNRPVPWLLDNPTDHPEGLPHVGDLYRFFEFVECRSRLNGAGGWDYAQAAPEDRDQRQQRVAGKINLNLVTDEEVFRALFDAPEAMPANATLWPIASPTHFFADPTRVLAWNDLWLSNGTYLSGAGSIDFGGSATGTIAATFWNLPRQQFGRAFELGASGATYPGRHPDELMSSELYRMFRLSLAGRDGILGTGDDKPFRSFSAERLSDTILRRRNFRTLDYPTITLTDETDDTAITGETTAPGEYITELGGQFTPRLFDPIPTPFNRPTPDDGAQPNIADKLEIASFPTTTPDAREYWMMEHRRNRLLGKIANNVTTRSNVFGVWITIGLFRVQPGTENFTVPLLNEEIGVATGENIRHRAFFIVDRSRVTDYEDADVGANPPLRDSPGPNDPIRYTRIIE